jgi:hypothetical protein
MRRAAGSGSPGVRLHVAVLVVLALAVAAVAAPVQAASCAGDLPVRARLLTTNASALERVGIVRVTSAGGVRVRDLHVTLERAGRMVAQASRAPALAGNAALWLRFERRARPGSASLVVSGRQDGCAQQRIRRSLRLDDRDLPLRVRVTDRDPSDRGLAVTLRPSGAVRLLGVRARMIDMRGETVAAVARRSPLRVRARLRLALRRPVAERRVWLLVTATLRGAGAARRIAAREIELGSPRSPGAAALAEPAKSSAGEPVPPPGTAAPVVPPPPAPASGAVVQQVSVGWSGGHWQGSDSASFSAPGIGDGQLVCRPDTQWLRFTPADRSRDVSMMLWTFRDWEGASEYAIREPQMTQFTGPEFNEGFNKFTPPEKRSHGSFVGLVGDGLPAPGAFGGGRSPTEIRLTWSWDFTDLGAARCNVSATFTSQAAGSAGAVARGLSIGWNGAGGVPADPAAAMSLPGIGTVRLRCDASPAGVRELAVEADAALTALRVATYEGSDRSDRTLTAAPYVAALPNNGMVEATASGATPARLIASSRWKVNDPDPAQNSCRVSLLGVVG